MVNELCHTKSFLLCFGVFLFQIVARVVVPHPALFIIFRYGVAAIPPAIIETPFGLFPGGFGTMIMVTHVTILGLTPKFACFPRLRFIGWTQWL